MFARILGRSLGVVICIFTINGLIRDNTLVAFGWTQAGSAQAECAATSSIS